MAGEKLVIRSRTGVVTLGPGWCTKKLDAGRDLYSEVRAVERLEDIIGGGVLYEGWRYQAPSVLDVNEHERVITMTRAHGIPLRVLPSVECAAQAGRWLAIFHSSGGKDGCPRFGDFGPDHCFVDRVLRTVTLIDPGKECGKIEAPELDVGYMLSCLVLLGLQKRRNPIRLGRAFLEGYLRCAPVSLKRERLLGAVEAERLQTRRRWVRGKKGWHVTVLGVLGRAYGWMNALVVRIIVNDRKVGSIKS